MNTEISIHSTFLEKIDFQSNNCILKITGSIAPQMAIEFSENILNLDKRNMKFIPILVQSDGGDVDALQIILAAMEQCVTPIATFCFGHALSAAAIIFAMGSNGYRYMGPNSYIMFHEYSLGIENAKGCDIAAMQIRMSKVDKSINKKIEKHIGLDNNFFDKLGHADAYFDAKSAKQVGLANHIGYPTINFKLDLDMSINLKKGTRQEIKDEHERPYKYVKYITEALHKPLTEADEED